MIPRDNTIGNRTHAEHPLELGKAAKPGNDKKMLDNEAGNQVLRQMLGRTAMAPLLRDGTDTAYQLQRMVSMLQMGISTPEVSGADAIKNLLGSLFASPDQLTALLTQQEAAATLFKGEPFDILRDMLTQFAGNPNVKQNIAGLLKSFEFHVNLENSIKTILYQCENLLDFMFSKDREQFGQYLDDLSKMLLKQQKEATGPGASPYESAQLGAEPKEAAAILKNNLLPLLGEIVVKYYQSESIRDMVMVVVHNLVRVDKGTPEALQESVTELTDALGRLANLGDDFAADLIDALRESAGQAKLAENGVMAKIAETIASALRTVGNNPNAIRQAEHLLMSMLQNQSSLMNLLHFILPLELPGTGKVYAEMYVDPDSEEARRGKEESGRKIFLAAQSERHGTVELCFWESGERVELSMWCPGPLVEPLKTLKRPLGDLMLYHGYTLTTFDVGELERPHSVMQVFPKLTQRKVGIDVKI